MLSERRILCLKSDIRLEWRGQDGQDETEQGTHYPLTLGDSLSRSRSGCCRRKTRENKTGDSEHLAPTSTVNAVLVVARSRLRSSGKNPAAERRSSRCRPGCRTSAGRY